MDWLELHIDTTHTGLEPVETMLSAHGIDGVVIDRAAIPIHPATAEIAAALGLDKKQVDNRLYQTKRRLRASVTGAEGE